LRVFIPPCLPTVISFLPALNNSICSPSHRSIDSHLLESKSNPSIQVWTDSLWEKANKPLLVERTLMSPRGGGGE
jgi:hypothetical protein